MTEIPPIAPLNECTCNMRGSQMQTEHPLQSDNGDESINSRLLKEIDRWWIHNLTHFCTSSSEWNQRPWMSVFRSTKMWKSQGERSGLYGECWIVSQPNLWSLSLTRLAVWEQALSCTRMIPSDNIPGCFNIMACRSTLNHQETNHTSFCLPPFPMLDQHTLYYAHLQSNKETTVWTCAFSLCVSPTLQMAVSICNNSVASFCEECVL